jgi:hypothetical protein
MPDRRDGDSQEITMSLMFRVEKKRGDTKLLAAMRTIVKLHEQADRLRSYAAERC